MVGAEMPMTSDQVIWSEQNRLHISYSGVAIANQGGATLSAITIAAPAVNTISINDTIVVLNPVTGGESKGIVVDSGAYGGSALAAGVIHFQPFDNVRFPAAIAAVGCKIFVYGSDYQKGQSMAGAFGAAGAVPAANAPRISVDPGTSGYLWYLKAESETRLRFEDYLEMSMVEAEFNQVGNQAAINLSPGSEGLFAAIQSRGNVQTGFTAAAGLDEFDAILKNLDTQGAIEENMLFLQRQTSLDFDDMLASISGGFAGGTAFGLFENSEEMALNLGFSGFRRGSYDFYKTDWKYLNDASTRGGIVGINSIEGVLVPAGTSTVYDQILGTNIRRPFLHVRYRASQSDDRRMKSWLTGSAGGAMTSTLDAMEVNFLSERCLVTQAANNI